MKQFIVDRHTTPNTPTLEQVPTEKVPIYETLAAAESDLANLDAGQIIATPDTGNELLNVTDTVQAGNMHAVTSNAVYDNQIHVVSFSKEVQTGSFFQILDTDYPNYPVADYDIVNISFGYTSGNTNAACICYSVQSQEASGLRNIYLRSGTSLITAGETIKGYIMFMKKQS